MHEDNNYALIMLDLHSPTVEIKLKTLDLIETLPDKKMYLNGLKKLSKSKYPDVKKKAQSILKTLDLGPDKVESKQDQQLVELEEVNRLLENNLDKNSYIYFQPFIRLKKEKTAKAVPIPTDARERVQKLLSAPKPLDKINALFLSILIPFEYKNKVTIIVDLLRDKSPFIVTTTFKYLHLVDKEVIQKVIPVIIERLKIDSPEGVAVILEFLEELHPDLFTNEINAIRDGGIDARIAKSLSNKLSSILTQ